MEDSLATVTYKNSNFVCFGGFPREGGNAKMLPTVTFAFKCTATIWSKDEIDCYSFTLCTAGSVQYFFLVASTAVCRHLSCTAIVKKI